jgi:hypothetical protein
MLCFLHEQFFQSSILETKPFQHGIAPSYAAGSAIATLSHQRLLKISLGG